ncbi:hypothetical protein C8R43DRAFT_831306, partial [Mycena crocata]
QLDLPADVPVNLWAVSEVDRDGRPTATIPMLIKLAIHGSQDGMLTTKDICEALCSRFEWYNANREDRSWRASCIVRHALSLHRAFKSVERPDGNRGLGGYWMLDFSSGDGYTRSRKRKRSQ